MKRDLLLAWLLEREGAPYIWGGKGLALWTPRGLVTHNFRRPSSASPIEVYDCAGLVTCAIRAATGRDLRASYGADTLARGLDDLPPLQRGDGEPRPGDIACYGQPDRLEHVMFWMGDGRVYGACGGGSHITTLEAADTMLARVQYRAELRYRPDFQFFVQFPLP